MRGLKIFAELSLMRLLGLAVLLSAAYYFLYFDDGTTIQEQISAQDGVRADVERRKSDTHKTMKKEEEMRGNVEQVALNLKSVSSKIPIDFTPVEISAIVNKVSVASRVKIITLKGQGSPDAALRPPTAPGGPVGAELIEEVVFNVELQGSFNALVQFVEGLSKEEKTIKVRNFSLDKSDVKAISDNQLNFRGEVVGFKQAGVQAEVKK